jgi:hypothetical protein
MLYKKKPGKPGFFFALNRRIASAYTVLSHKEMCVMSLRPLLFSGLLLSLPMAAQAAGTVCHSELLTSAPVRPTLLSTIAIEFAPATTQLGGASGVLTQSFDEALSVDNVLSRIRLDGCRATAKAATVTSAVASADPAAYKPRTEFDNAPWRFDMTQNGKRMTADEFDAWMKARGVRVVGGNAAAPATQPEKQAD